MGTFIFGIIVLFLIVHTYVDAALSFLMSFIIAAFYLGALWFIGQTLDLRYKQKYIRYLLPILLILCTTGYLLHNGTGLNDFKYLF